MGRDSDALKEFYDSLAKGALPETTQINQYQYYEYFKKLLSEGDVFHITLGTGMTSSYNNAVWAAEVLRSEYPDRELIITDSLCSSSGYGMLVDYAADLRDSGCSVRETESWVLNHRQKIYHQFISTDLSYFRRSGRVSGISATIGNVLNICPLMRLDKTGHIVAYDKVRGTKKALSETVLAVKKQAKDGCDYAGKLWICHSDYHEYAQTLKSMLTEAFPKINGEIPIYDIGNIIASHCGPGTVAVFFIGDKDRPENV